MPDNLMKDTGNTQAPNHLLIVQKTTGKATLSAEEQLLIGTVEQQNEFGKYNINMYLADNERLVIGDEIKAGTNQYGRSTQTVWQHGDINQIKDKLSAQLTEGFHWRFDKEAFSKSQELIVVDKQLPKLTFLPPPENIPDQTTVQLGLFYIAPPENINRAFAYISQQDALAVQKKTARIVGRISTDKNPAHESMVPVTARKNGKEGRFIYKLYSNIREIAAPEYWLFPHELENKLAEVATQLKQYDYSYRFEGDSNIKNVFGFDKPSAKHLTDLRPFYTAGTLVLHNGKAGIKEQPKDDKALFVPFENGHKNPPFYESYIAVRDSYMSLYEKEKKEEVEYLDLRQTLNETYTTFKKQFGLLNKPENRRLVLNDNAYGFMMLSSLERKEDGQYVRADILDRPVFQKKAAFKTDNPVEALAVSLNEKGKVDIAFIGSASGLSNDEVIASLGRHIYVNPLTGDWETADQYLSGNVVRKLAQAEEAVSANGDNPQLQKSLAAIINIQPEKIPFELLDFNFGERWVPKEFYDRFVSHIFELPVGVYYLSSIDTFKVEPGTEHAVRCPRTANKV